jgi:hypothetical protein
MNSKRKSSNDNIQEIQLNSSKIVSIVDALKKSSVIQENAANIQKDAAEVQKKISAINNITKDTTNNTSTYYKEIAKIGLETVKESSGRIVDRVSSEARDVLGSDITKFYDMGKDVFKSFYKGAKRVLEVREKRNTSDKFLKDISKSQKKFTEKATTKGSIYTHDTTLEGIVGKSHDVIEKQSKSLSVIESQLSVLRKMENGSKRILAKALDMLYDRKKEDEDEPMDILEIATKIFHILSSQARDIRILREFQVEQMHFWEEFTLPLRRIWKQWITNADEGTDLVVNRLIEIRRILSKQYGISEASVKVEDSSWRFRIKALLSPLALVYWVGKNLYKQNIRHFKKVDKDNVKELADAEKRNQLLTGILKGVNKLSGGIGDIHDYFISEDKEERREKKDKKEGSWLSKLLGRGIWGSISDALGLGLAGDVTFGMMVHTLLTKGIKYFFNVKNWPRLGLWGMVAYMVYDGVQGWLKGETFEDKALLATTGILSVPMKVLEWATNTVLSLLGSDYRIRVDYSVLEESVRYIYKLMIGDAIKQVKIWFGGSANDELVKKIAEETREQRVKDGKELYEKLRKQRKELFDTYLGWVDYVVGMFKNDGWLARWIDDMAAKHPGFKKFMDVGSEYIGKETDRAKKEFKEFGADIYTGAKKAKKQIIEDAEKLNKLAGGKRTASDIIAGGERVKAMTEKERLEYFRKQLFGEQKKNTKPLIIIEKIDQKKEYMEEGTSTVKRGIGIVKDSAVNAYSLGKEKVKIVYGGGEDLVRGFSTAAISISNLTNMLKKRETGGKGPTTVDPGIVNEEWAFGSYQMITDTAKSFLKEYDLLDKFHGLQEKSQQWADKWVEVVKTTGTGAFKGMEDMFMVKSHFLPFIEKLKDSIGVNFAELPSKFQEYLLSLANIHGVENEQRGTGAIPLLRKAFKDVKDKSSLTLDDMLGRIHGERTRMRDGRLAYYTKTPENVLSGVREGLERERNEVLEQLKTLPRKNTNGVDNAKMEMEKNEKDAYNERMSREVNMSKVTNESIDKGTLTIASLGSKISENNRNQQNFITSVINNRGGISQRDIPENVEDRLLFFDVLALA